MSTGEQVRMEATSDEATPINLANHAYYNLAGHGAGSQALYDHFVSIRKHSSQLKTEPYSPS